MDNRITGIIAIIIGLIFIVFPIFSADLISILIGLSVIVFGCALIYSGYISKDMSSIFSTVSLVIGIILIILGLLFVFAINAVSFLVGLQFYIIGFILICAAIIELLNRTPFKLGALINLLFGIIVIILAIYVSDNPIVITMILGILLIANGIVQLLFGNNFKSY